LIQLHHNLSLLSPDSSTGESSSSDTKESSSEEPEEQIMYLGVYDGHNGNQAAEYVRIHLHYNIITSPFFKTNIDRAIIEGYQKTDSGFARTATLHKFDCGTTALGVFLFKDRIVVTNVGDTCCVLATTNSVVELSSIHSPQSEKEKQRITSSGGVVIWYGRWRVNGQLAVSRSIGDLSLKKFVICEPAILKRDLVRSTVLSPPQSPSQHLFQSPKQVQRCPEPVSPSSPLQQPHSLSQSHLPSQTPTTEESKTVEGQSSEQAQPQPQSGEGVGTGTGGGGTGGQNEEEEFLILATDGLWDVFSYQDAVDFVRKVSSSRPKQEIPKALCEEAIERKSGDNITIIIVWL